MNLVAYLSDARRALTVQEIISTVPGYPENQSSARRAFERDKEELRAMSFDVALEDTPNSETGYRIHKESTYFDVNLTPPQRSIVEYALALYGPEKQLAVSAVTKLGGMNPENEVREVTSLALPTFVDQLFAACSTHNAIVIVFRDDKRTIIPQRLIARSGYWYLQADDLDKNESRTFRVDRISNILSSDRVAEDLPDGIKNMSDDDSLTIRAHVHPHLVSQFCDTWSATVDEQGLVNFSIPRKELFLARLYEYSGFVAVVEPKELVDEINKAFTDTLAMMKSGV